MNNRRAIDLEILIPLLVGGLSVMGIVFVVLLGRFRNAPAEIAMTPSATPFQYIYLGTEPAITTLVVEGSELPPTGEPITEEPIFEEPIITEEPITEEPVFQPTATRRASTPVILTPNATRAASGTPSRTPTVGRTNTPSAANTYDDSEVGITYSNGWVRLTDVNGVYQGTLHVSNSVGNTVSFLFTGTIIHLFYQAGPSLGTITVIIDNDNLDAPQISQAQNTTQIKEWVSEVLSDTTHTIVIQHTSGGSINVDRFYIPVPTPTPTRTPTPTP